jgi:endonuclease/exonuclease/phosphatase family metal-dependent hydrolase
MARYIYLLPILFCLACGGGSDDIGGTGDGTDGSDDTSGTGDGTDGSDDTSGTGDGTDGSEKDTTTIRVVSWNVGLAHGYVPLGAARQPHVIAALDTIDADVICLQELWTEEDREAARSALESRGYNTHIHVPDIEAEYKTPCDDALLLALKECLEEKCPETIGTDGMTNCAVDECPLRVAPLGPDCIGCLTKDLTEPLDDIIARCTTETEVVPYAYDGHNGLLLATKAVMSAVSGVDLKASLTFRSYIQATINAGALGDVTLACTHLSADLSVPYMGEFSGFPEEQAYQIDTITQALPADSPVILMGDMNTGPSLSEAITAELSENFQKFVDAGWTSHMVDSCTWCPELNSLITPGGSDHVIDHVLTNGAGQPTGESTRILDQLVTIQDDKGNDLESSLSDHFGVQTLLTFTVE